MGSSRKSKDGHQSPPATQAGEAPVPQAVVSALITPEDHEERQRLLEDAWHNLDLYANSKRFRDKVEREQGSSLVWMTQQIDCLLLVVHEYQLSMFKILMCHFDEHLKSQALAVIVVLSQVSQRYAIERQYLQNMLAKEPPVPRQGDVIEATEVRTLPSPNDWEAMFQSE